MKKYWQPGSTKFKRNRVSKKEVSCKKVKVVFVEFIMGSPTTPVFFIVVFYALREGYKTSPTAVT